MNIKNRFALALHSLSKQSKAFYLSVVLVAVALVLLCLSLIIELLGVRFNKNIDKNFTCDRNQLLFYDTQRSAVDPDRTNFFKELSELEFVSSFGGANVAESNMISYPQLGKIQRENGFSGEVGQEVRIDASLLPLYKLELAEGEWKTSDNYRTIYLYLGADFAGKVAVGTTFADEKGDEEYMVAGILKSNSYFPMDDLIADFSKIATTFQYESKLDNRIIKLLPTSRAEWRGFISIKNGYLTNNVINQIYQLAHKENIDIHLGEFVDILKEIEHSRSDITHYMRGLALKMALIIIILVSGTQLLQIIKEMSEYGIYYSLGMTVKDLCSIVFIKNIVGMFVAFMAGIIGCIFAIKIMSFSMNMDFSELISLFYGSPTIIMFAFSMLTGVIASILPALFIAKLKPIELIGGNDT